MIDPSAAVQLSVVIAAYNAERTLGAQLASLASQVVPFEWEILVCDNGSTDGTAELVRQWQVRASQLRLLDASAVRGPGAARNVGAAAARGFGLAFCDADDVVDDGWVAEMHRALTVESFVAGRSRRPELNSRPEAPHFFEFDIYHVHFFPELASAGAGNMGVRRSVFREVGGFDTMLQTGEDLDLCWRIQLAGYTLATWPTANVRVTNRQTLRASFSQGYAYGLGDKRLAHKYARVIGAIRANATGPAARQRSGGRPQPAPTSAQDEAKQPSGRTRSAAANLVKRGASKLVRTRRRSDLMHQFHVAGVALGFRFGRIDTSAPQLEPAASSVDDEL